jgi:hypothetical protein
LATKHRPKPLCTSKEETSHPHSGSIPAQKTIHKEERLLVLILLYLIDPSTSLSIVLLAIRTNDLDPSSSDFHEQEVAILQDSSGNEFSQESFTTRKLPKMMNVAGLTMVPSLESRKSSPTNTGVVASSPVPRSRLTPRKSREFSQENCSLPLKKRRFFHMETTMDDGVPLVNESPLISPSSSDAASTSMLLNPTLDKTEDERMAALALISASSVQLARIYSSPPPQIPMARPPKTPAAHQKIEDDPLSAAIAITCLATPRSDTGKPLTTVSSSDLMSILNHRLSLATVSHGFVNTVSPLPAKPSPVQCHEESVASTTSSLSVSSSEDIDEQAREDDTSTVTSSTPKSPQVSGKRLTMPLPGGCHGKTSRYNSFCRRQPCFNGSDYCKLHYSLYVQGSKADASVAASSIAAAPSFPAMVSKSTAHQDKRFTGSNGEIRCQATTTRGKACAYVAVGSPNPSSKYCHLHANFDTNPPARRNKSALIASTTALMKKGDNVFVVGRKKQSKTAAADAVDSQLQSDGAASGDAQPSFRLLSMLSTDHWFHKRVIISTGPFMNRTGSVTRWGNGWVTVRLEDAEGSDENRSNHKKDQSKDGIAHNRRSFELFLHPDQGDGETVNVGDGR